MDHIGRLVHPDARASDFECARHRFFIATRLGQFLATIVSLPIYLACGHVPVAWEAVALAWLTVPLVAAGYVSRTGKLAAAETAAQIAWIGFAVTAFAGGGLSLCGAWALLLIVPLDATASSSSRLALVSLLVAATVAAALGLADAFGMLSPSTTSSVLNDTAIVGPSLLYGVILAVTAAELQMLRQVLQAAGEQRYRVLAETIGDLVLRYDRTGGVLMASREAEQMFGVKPRDLLGRGFFERVHVADRPAFLKLFSDAAATGENVATSLRFRTSTILNHDGQFDEPVFAWVEIRARRFAAADALRHTSDPAVVAIVRDISAQIRHEQAMQQAREEAERANQWKDGFLANVSHELRTPLNAIIGFSEMLANDDLRPRDLAKQREYAGIIASSGQHLLAVVNSLLDVSKIEAGRFDLNPEQFDLAALIQTCCDMIGLKAEQASVTLSKEIGTVGDLVGDKRACKQIVLNLLSNALKFTPAGGQVSIGTRLQGNAVLITVADTGVGIAAKDLARLGDAFFQAKTGYNRPHEGTGLGLSVVRGLVGLHGGGIAIESAPGVGTKVTVRLPLDCRTAVAGVGSVAAKIETTARYSKSIGPAFLADVAKVQKIA